MPGFRFFPDLLKSIAVDHHADLRKLKAYNYKKVGLVDLSTHGGKIKFEICRPAQRCLDSQNSNLIFPRNVLKSPSPTFLL